MFFDKIASEIKISKAEKGVIKMRKQILVLFFCLFLFNGMLFSDAGQIGTSGNNFLKIIPPAKPAGMGEAYMVVGDDINSIRYNPAGLAKSMAYELSFTHMEWFQSVRMEIFSLLRPLSFGNLAFLVNGVSVGEMPRTEPGAAPGTWDDLYVMYPYSFHGAFSYSTPLGKDLYFGANLKIINYSIDSQSSNGSALSAGIDLGIIYDMEFLQGLSAAIAFRNVGTQTTFIDESYMQPLQIKAGIGYSGAYFAAEVSGEYSLDNDINFYAGAQVTLFDVLNLRAGYKGGTMNQPTFGAGFMVERVAVDYAFVPFWEEDLGLTHRISLSYQFGAPESKIKAVPPVFSPNKDKFYDYTNIVIESIPARSKVKAVTVEVLDSMKMPVRTARAGANVSKLVWNGLNDFGLVVPDGEYYIKIKVKYNNGLEGESNLAMVEVDNTPPSVSVGASPKMVKPGTGTALVVPVTFDPSAMDLHGISKWRLIIATASDNKVFKTFTGVGEPMPIIWDGTDNTGMKQVSTGTDYKYVFMAADGVGNWGKSREETVKILLREVVINLSSDTLFDPGKADVKIRVYKDLQKIADEIKKYKNSTVIVEGHTDNIPMSPGARYTNNVELSQYRAEAVVKFFAELFGIDKKIFKAEGKGELYPVDTNDTAEGRKNNRRVTIRIRASQWE